MTSEEITTPIYRVNQVTKVYNGKVALEPISLTISKGEKVALVGPSGSGKTTLLHLLAGVTQPDSGAIEISGRNLAEMRPGKELASKVGVIHQQFDLVPHLSVLHNVLAGRLGDWGLGRSIASLLWPRERHVAEEALLRVGIPEKISQRTSRLSGGEQQRVAIARLLVQNPEIFIADEPVSSLDPARARDIIELLSGIADESGNTLIASLHLVELARENFTRVIGLRNGSLWFDMAAENLTDEILTELYELEGLKSDTIAQV